MYEKRTEKLLSRNQFAIRLGKHFMLALLLLVISLLIGIAGHVYFENISWQQGLLNSSMLLGGLGIASVPATTSGQLFASLYALYAAFIFITTTSIIIAPIFHRFLHCFHWDDAG